MVASCFGSRNDNKHITKVIEQKIAKDCCVDDHLYIRNFKVVTVGSYPWLQISALGWEETAGIALGLCRYLSIYMTVMNIGIA